MFLTGLQVENFKRLFAVDLTFAAEGGLIEICGENAEGKSSTIDAIWAALGGAKAAPEQPIKHGHLSASITLRLETEGGALSVTRRFTPKGTSLVVTDADGEPVRRPQDILDALYSALVDPLSFMGQKPAQQVQTLRELVGLDFADLDQKRKAAYDDRTLVNRDVKSLEAQVAAAAHYEDVGTEGKSIEEATAAYRDALEQKKRNDAQRGAHRVTLRQIGERNERIQEIAEQIEALQQKLEGERVRRDSLGAQEALESKALKALVDPDTETLAAQIKDVESHNLKARANRHRETLAAQLKQTEAKSAKLTREIDQAEADRTLRLKSAAFPVPGLSIDADTVTLNGIPLAQASTAEQIKACLAISAALKPKLRVILVREGSMLGRRNLGIVADWARENGYQVFLERVADQVARQGVVIEDGRVAASTLHAAPVADALPALDEAPC